MRAHVHIGPSLSLRGSAPVRVDSEVLDTESRGSTLRLSNARTEPAQVTATSTTANTCHIHTTTPPESKQGGSHCQESLQAPPVARFLIRNVGRPHEDLAALSGAFGLDGGHRHALLLALLVPVASDAGDEEDGDDG